LVAFVFLLTPSSSSSQLRVRIFLVLLGLLLCCALSSVATVDKKLDGQPAAPLGSVLSGALGEMEVEQVQFLVHTAVSGNDCCIMFCAEYRQA